MDLLGLPLGVRPSLIAFVPFLAAAFASAQVTSAPPLAAPDRDGGPVDVGELADLIDFLDRDRDGRIEAYEGAEAFLHLVDEADSGGDGALSEQELAAFLRESRTREAAEREEEFVELDADRDGLVTADELPEEFSGILVMVDRDGDGALSLAEVLEADVLDDPRVMLEQELLAFLAEVDADGDGAFALADLPLPERMEFAAEFAELDANADDLVDKAELLALVEEELRGARFDVRGTNAVMTGAIGPTTPGRVLELILEHPRVERIVMQDVPGSLDDDANLRAARYVRQRGLATHVPAGGEVASGGTDFFQAGTARTRGAGARFGVHSWSGFGEEGAEVPRDDPEHVKYLEYYREMGIPEDFYWYTLEAAPADDIHWMTEEELVRFRMLTDEAPADLQEVESDLFCGCILTEPRGEIPAELARVTAVTATDDYGPLPKQLTACGIVLAAEAAVPDRFLEQVGRTIAEVFRFEEGVDAELQARVLTQLHAYRALLPVPRDEASLERLIQAAPHAFEQVQRENSLCDIIMAEVPEGQVMEVVEHILHAITDVGLHHQFPDEWGISRESQLWEAMQRAIERGHYVIDSYDDLKHAGETDVYERVLLQEFAYWFISSAWNLQEPYGPDEREWTLRTRAELRHHYPEFYAVYERTAERVMRAPKLETLAAIGPTRAEERGR